MGEVSHTNCRGDAEFQSLFFFLPCNMAIAGKSPVFQRVLHLH